MIRDQFDSERALFLLGLRGGHLLPVKPGEPEIVLSEETANILRAQVLAGESFSTFEGNDEVKYPDEDAPGRANG